MTGWLPLVAGPLLVAFTAAPALAFLDPPYWQTLEPLPEELDRPLYCAEVLYRSAGVWESKEPAGFHARIAAADLLSKSGMDGLLAAGWPEGEAHDRYALGIVPEVEAHWEGAALRYSEADCLRQARGFRKIEVAAELDRLISCSQLLLVRADEQRVQRGEADEAATLLQEQSTGLAARALDWLQKRDLDFAAALEIVHTNGLVELIAMEQGRGTLTEQGCLALAADDDAVPAER